MDLSNRVNLSVGYPIKTSAFSDIYQGVLLPDEFKVRRVLQNHTEKSLCGRRFLWKLYGVTPVRSVATGSNVGSGVNYGYGNG